MRSFAVFSVWPLLLILLTFSSASGVERQKLVVVGDHDNPPYEFLEKGKPTGFNIDRGSSLGTIEEMKGKEVIVQKGDAMWGILRYFVWSLAIVAGLMTASSIWSWILRREVNKRTAELREREESLRFTQFAIENAADQAFWMTEVGRIFYVNDAACRTLGYTREELAKMSIPDIDPFYQPEKFAEHWRDLQENGFARFETLHKAKDGRIYPVEIRANYVVFDGKEYNCAFATDISERKRAEEQLRNSEGRLRTLVHTLPDLVWLKDKNGVFLCCNSMFERLYNAAESDIVGKTDYDFVDRELADFFTMNDRKSITAGKPTINEEWLTFADDGHRALVETIKTPVYDDAGGLIGVLGIGRDITRRKRAEEELRENEDKFRVLSETSPAAICVYQGEYIVYLNAAMLRLTGYTEQELMQMRFWEWMHEDYREPARERGLARQRGETVPSNYEIKYLTKDGDARWLILSAGRIEFKGKPAGIVTMFDITDRKRMEDELRQAHGALEKRVEERTAELRRAKEEWERTFASVPDLIAILDNRHRVVRVNQAMAKRLGVRPEECVGLHCYEAIHGLSEPPSFCPHTQTLGDCRKHVVEVYEERLGGDFLVSTIPLNDERGVMTGSLHIAYDITERKRAEEALKESEARVRRKLESILDPEGDIVELDLADIIDAQQIQALMDDLYRNTGVKMSIIDLRGRVLVDVGWQDICLKFHRGHPETRERCRESDTVMAEGVPQGEFRTYRCRNNMWHLVTPIFVGGRHMGNLFMGQFFFENEELDYDLFRAQARQYGFPEVEYMAALEAVPRHSEECLDGGKAFFLRLIDMFSRLSYGNIKLAHSLAERDRLTETLRESEALLKLAMDLAKLGAWEYDAGTGMFSFDDQFYALYGTTAEREGGPLMPAEVYARKFIPPEESAVIADGIEHIRTNSDLQVEHRIIRADGEERFIVVRGEAVFDQEGRFVKIRGANQDITERKRAEEEIRDSRAKYQAIVDNFEGFIYICSQDYRVEFMNGKLKERTGYDATGEFCYRIMHDRDSVCPWCVNERVFAGETVHWEMFSPKDNRWFYVVNVPIHHSDGTVSKQSMMLDVTVRKLAEEELRKANMVVENSPVVVFRCKAAPGWPVEMVSKNVVQFGYAPEEFLSGELTYSSIVYSRDLERLIAETEEFSATGKGQWSQEYRIVTEWGDIRWILDETDCIRNEGGEITHYEGVIIDVTERRKAEEQLILQQIQLRDLNRTLEKRVHEEVEKNREKDIILIQQNRQAALGEMLDHIAHQWKQPLNSIALIIQLLKESWSCGELTDEDVEDAVGNTLAIVEHMSQTITVFRNFYKPEKEPVLFRLKDSIDTALSFMAPALRYHGIIVEIEADPELSAIGYPNEYAQVLLNILTNARDTFKERIVDKPVLNIKAHAENEKAVVAITDNAGGIPDAIIGKIFDLYFTTREASEGTGIGLYMSKNIIEKNMAGKLSVANVDDGAQFRIEISMT